MTSPTESMAQSPAAYVHLAYGIGAEGYRARFQAGEVPDETPYGLHHATAAGWKVAYSIDHPEGRMMNVLRRGLIRIVGFDVVHAWRNRRGIAAADIVWTMEEVEYLAVCALALLLPGQRQARILAQTVWLFNHWESYSALRKWFLRKLLRRADVLTFHSEKYPQLVEALVPGVRTRLLPFGISLDSFPWTERMPVRHTPLRVLSMGSDATRDWATLLRAFGNDDRFELRVVSPRLSDAEARLWRNLQVPRNPTMKQFRDLYAWADVVVLPMVPNLYSGITVALEAAAMGVPLICSGTGGVPTYFSGEEALYVPPQDTGALRDAALHLTAERMEQLVRRAQWRFRELDYSSRGMAMRYIALSEQILNREVVREAA